MPGAGFSVVGGAVSGPLPRWVSQRQADRARVPSAPAARSPARSWRLLALIAGTGVARPRGRGRGGRPGARGAAEPGRPQHLQDREEGAAATVPQSGPRPRAPPRARPSPPAPGARPAPACAPCPLRPRAPAGRRDPSPSRPRRAAPGLREAGAREPWGRGACREREDGDAAGRPADEEHRRAPRSSPQMRARVRPALPPESRPGLRRSYTGAWAAGPKLHNHLRHARGFAHTGETPRTQTQLRVTHRGDAETPGVTPGSLAPRRHTGKTRPARPA